MAKLTWYLELNTLILKSLHGERGRKFSVWDSLDDKSANFRGWIWWHIDKLLVISCGEYLRIIDEWHSIEAKFRAILSHLWRFIARQWWIWLYDSFLVHYSYLKRFIIFGSTNDKLWLQRVLESFSQFWSYLKTVEENWLTIMIHWIRRRHSFHLLIHLCAIAQSLHTCSQLFDRASYLSDLHGGSLDQASRDVDNKTRWWILDRCQKVYCLFAEVYA